MLVTQAKKGAFHYNGGMRILYIGSTESSACASYYADAAEQLGHEVHRWNPHLWASTTPWEKLHQRFTHRPAARALTTAHEQLIDQVKTLKIDLVMNIAENFIPLQTLKEIKSLASKAPRLMYHSHDNNFAPGILKPDDFFDSLAVYDCVFTTKSQNLPRYKMLGQPYSFFIPSAFEPKYHRPILSGESRLGNKQFPISFVGTYDRSRDRFLEAVQWDQLYVWGDRWNRFSKYSKYRDHIVPHAVYFPDFADIMSHSEIALGLLREEAEDRHTQRTFEIPACGAFQLAPRNDEILSFFDEDREIVCFQSLEELQDKVAFYLRHPTLRQQIAQAGHVKVMQSQHSYLDRVKTMLTKLSQC
ncbi:glycosyltransferase family 1 protein [bacterium]|nr:glycosyltransferase family 1 protein [bacterium]NBX81752.1 glycosyltransferase family 1 protein [bacterium]